MASARTSSELVVFIGQQNGEADQRRAVGSAIPLDSIRRLIQRLVIPVCSGQRSRWFEDASSSQQRCGSRGWEIRP